MDDTRHSSSRQLWTLTLAAAAILLITMGVRQTSGLFLIPITQSTGVSIVAMSFALAVGQFMFGAAQPVFGAIADKFGAEKVVIAGAIMLALGCVLTPLATSSTGLLLTMGVLSAAGAAAGSFSILIGIAAQRLPPERRSFAAGLINAGGSVGQSVFAPLVQLIIGAAGWTSAMFASAFAALLTIPLVLPLRRRQTAGTLGTANLAPVPHLTLGEQLRVALRDPSYLCLHAGFFTCGFHIAFIATHLPGYVALCQLPATVSAWSLSIIGLFNIAGSLWVGRHIQNRRMKLALAGVYFARAVAILIFFFSPKVPIVFFSFAAVIGFTYLSTVPPTIGLVAKLHGPRYLATLFGLVMLSHQVGGFLGAWLGGKAFEATGSYDWMWWADIALCLFAAAVHLPIREARPQLAAAAA
jgi:predicted MFS family arabinose efflux permease